MQGDRNMSRDRQSFRAAVGFRVKTGWATAVLLAGPVQSPRILDRRVIDLCDSAVPESKQPYHAAMGQLEENDAKVEGRVKIVRRVTKASVLGLLEDYRDAGWQVRDASLAVGSEIDPASIKNPHIRAHALEGRLFRTVLEDALQACGLSCSILVERRAYSKAISVLSQSEDKLKRTVLEIGRLQNGPWRADEKIAALVAWMSLA